MSIITCNWIKHHLKECQQKILLIKDSDNNQKTLIDEIKRIGNNVFDFYTGSFTNSEIEAQILYKLSSEKIVNKETFSRWLGKNCYKKLTLSDGSYWILRLGKSKEKFVHIHPARTGIHTKRIKGSAWKTALTITVLKIEPNIENINKVRKDVLLLSPVKHLQDDSEIVKAIKFLKE